MDRFIDKAAVMYIWQFGVFKIQYGQIYRMSKSVTVVDISEI